MPGRQSETQSADLASSVHGDVGQTCDRNNEEGVRPPLDRAPEKRDFRIGSHLVHSEDAVCKSAVNVDFGDANEKSQNKP